MDPSELYRPSFIAGTVFSKMFHCGAEANHWLEYAFIHCFPVELMAQWKGRLAFLCADRSDAFRVGRSLRENRELIVLSERVVPAPGKHEGDPDVRYFVFVCLHETAHAIKQHSPTDEITETENAAQEAEADELALTWMNDYLRQRNHPHLPLMMLEEVERAKARNRATDT